MRDGNTIVTSRSSEDIMIHDGYLDAVVDDNFVVPAPEVVPIPK